MDTQTQPDAPVLASTPPFTRLTEEQLAPLLAVLMPWEPDGAPVQVHQDEPAREILIVTEGALEGLWRDAQDGLEYHGPRHGPGEVVGLEEVVLRKPHSFTWHATPGTRGVALPAGEVQDLLARDPSFHLAMLSALAERLHTRPWMGGSRFVDLARLHVDESLWTLLPPAMIQRYKALPLARNGNVLVVGFADPSNVVAQDDVARALLQWRIRPVALEPREFARYYSSRVAPALEVARGHDPTRDRWFAALRGKAFDVRIVEAAAQALEDKTRPVPGEAVVALLNRLVGEAMEIGASDIHLEPNDGELVVRYRVDGHLRRRPDPIEPRFQAPLVSRVKVLARMDIADRRRPQDGRLTVEVGGRPLDFRISTVPTRNGEKVVIRILDPASILMDLERLVPHQPTYRAMRWMIDQPQGLIVVAGPTGSGKTTTIYSALLRLRQDDTNIVTIEDPIEYTIAGVTQVQVNDAAGVTFAAAVPHFLRQDPDVILVGETRDTRTAATTVEAALTGHLVLTTLHTTSAAGALARFREMGMEPFLLAHTLVGVISQRLVRRVCPTCCRPTAYHPDLLRPLGLFSEAELASGPSFLKGSGCTACNHQGYRGRVAIFEVLRVDERLRPVVASGVPIEALERAGREMGLLLTLGDYARYLLQGGFTTPEEVARVLFVDR